MLSRAFSFALLIGLLVSLSGCGSTGPTTKTESAKPAAVASEPQPSMRGLPADGPLDDESVPGVSVSALQKQIGRELRLPSGTAMGTPTKVVVVGGPSSFEVGVRFGSGVTLLAVPGSGQEPVIDPRFEAQNQPFKDGEKHNFVQELPNGRKALVVTPGVQLGGNEVEAVVEFESGGVSYSLYAPDMSPDWVGKLKAAAATLD